MKLYFDIHGERCQAIADHLQDMQANNEAARLLFEAKIARGTGFFYCQYYDEVGESGLCGKVCNEYKPRNLKSGICKHHSHVYEQSGKTITINLNNDRTKNKTTFSK